MPKPQDATGTEADIFLCVAGAEQFAALAFGVTFLMITQNHEGSDRLIFVDVADPRDTGKCNVQEQPPSPDIRF